MADLIPLHNVELSQTGLRWTVQPTFDAWAAAGAQLDRVDSSYLWWRGDWYNAGDYWFGEEAPQALPEDPATLKTIQNAAWVCSRFEPSRRRAALSFAHHAEVAGLEPADADELLDASERNGWSRSKLRAAVRAYKDIAAGGNGLTAWSRADLLAEREAAVETLHRLCDLWGDTDWSDSLPLSEILTDHLERHLGDR